MYNFQPPPPAPSAHRRADVHAVSVADPEATLPGVGGGSPSKHHRAVSAARPGLPPLDARSLDKLRDQALAKARALQAQVAAAAKDVIPASRAAVAAGFAVPSSSSAPPPRRPSLVAAVERSRAAALLARAAVAAYFVHLVVEDVRAWAATRGGVGVHPGGRPVPFPALSVVTVLPAALAVAAGVCVPAAAAALAVEMLAKSARLLLVQAALAWRQGRAPSELVAKKLAMVGAAALVAAHPVAAGLARDGAAAAGAGGAPRRDRGAASAAGPLLASAHAAAVAGLGRSALLLVGRVAVCALFAVGGLAQLRRVAARGWRPWRAVPVGSVAFDDGHDNNFLLLELALAVPYALGWRLPAVTRGLVVTLLAEACVCWPVWTSWPNRHFAAHVRSHFFVNVGVAAGLLLSRSYGGGAFAVDRLRRKKSH